ncbi:hypothetical protein [Rhizobium mesoamericanum]|uniref:hypothetical protein n=1 Tax=Rhizobium mesoamericanum TaxID=1079800 RepID=UPI0006877DAD|nr:hypothetical protein [Rhizobium mesoamericanum]
MTDPKAALEEQFPGKLARLIIAVWMLVGILPVSVPMFGFAFLPSNEWVSTSNSFGIAAGLISGAWIFISIVRRYEFIAGNEFKKFLSVIFTSLFGYVVGRNVALIVVPMPGAGRGTSD